MTEEVTEREKLVEAMNTAYAEYDLAATECGRVEAEFDRAEEARCGARGRWKISIAALRDYDLKGEG